MLVDFNELLGRFMTVASLEAMTIDDLGIVIMVLEKSVELMRLWFNETMCTSELCKAGIIKLQLYCTVVF